MYDFFSFTKYNVVLHCLKCGIDLYCQKTALFDIVLVIISSYFDIVEEMQRSLTLSGNAALFYSVSVTHRIFRLS